ncbi:MAG: CPBP family intramembrane metalloprotease [Chloroflexi bacterium]|nr:CPBP family intramembrane metalloprotease [Chloroflexota bacterium]
MLARLLREDPGPKPLVGAAARREATSTAVLTAALLAYANADAWIAERRERAERWAGAGVQTSLNPIHLTVLAFVLAWAFADRLTARDLGIGAQGLTRSALTGLLLGALGSVPIRLFFAFPLVTNNALRHPEFQGIGLGRLFWLIGAQFLIGTAVVEEVAFRGLLHAKLARLVGERRALVVGSAIFAAWHIVITWYNLRRSNLPPRLFPILYPATLAVLSGAGLLFGGLRQYTGNLVASVIAHWVMVVTIVLSVARPKRA